MACVRRLNRLLPLLLLVTLVAVGGGNVTAQPPPGPNTSVLEPVTCPPVGLSFATGTPVCGLFTVPEDHTQPENGRTVQVAVAVLPSISPERKPDPMVYLQGGPGGPAVIGLAGWARAMEPLLVDRDLVVIDQRGVGLSRPRLNCPEIVPYGMRALAQGVTDEEYVDGYFDTLGRCLDGLRSQGVNFAAYTSAQSAADTAAVVRALGYQEVNLFGISYGSRQVLTVVRDFGASGLIRSATIGGVYGPEANALEINLNLAESAGKLFEDCALNPACNAAYPDLRSRWGLYVDGLNRQPVTVTVPLGEGPVPVKADASIAYAAVFGNLVTSSGINALPELLDDAFKGGTRLLQRGVSAQLDELASLDWGLNAAVQCNEEFPLLTAAESDAIQAQTPPAEMGFALRFPESTPRLLSFCRSLNLPPPDPREDQPVRSDVPILVINGNLDPFTPPTWGARATALMPNRYLYVLGNAGHDSAFANRCALSLDVAFVADPRRAPDSSCVAGAASPSFRVPAPASP